MQGGIFGHHLSKGLLSDLENVPKPSTSHSIPFQAILERENSERRRNQRWTSSWKWVLAEGIPFWTTLLNNFQGSFLRFFDVFHYFHVWGN